MATFDNPFHRIGYPSVDRQGLRNDSRIASLPTGEKEQPVSSNREHTKETDTIFHSLIVSGKELTPRNHWAVVASSIFQLLLLMVLVVIPLFHTDPLPKREMVTKLYLPPAPSGAKAIKFQALKPSSTYTPKSIAIPAPVHVTPQAAPPPVGITGEEAGGVPGGMADGVPGAMQSGADGMHLAPSAPAPFKRIRIASRVAEANLIHDVPPQYPPEAGRERVEGTVVLMAVIGTDGSVKDVQVESGLRVLAQAAIEAVKQWRYKPYLLNGVPVEIDSRITINFTLS